MSKPVSKYLKYILVAAVLIGLVIIIFAARNITETVETVDQSSAPKPAAIANDSQVLRKGVFSNADAVHSGSGTASVIQTNQGLVIKFENFKVTAGPDLLVYLTKNNFENTKSPGEFVSLGKLKSTSGEQVYALPDNASEYASIIVWCRAFSVSFTGAVLR